MCICVYLCVCVWAGTLHAALKPTLGGTLESLHTPSRESGLLVLFPPFLLRTSFSPPPSVGARHAASRRTCVHGLCCDNRTLHVLLTCVDGVCVWHGVGVVRPVVPVQDGTGAGQD